MPTKGSRSVTSEKVTVVSIDISEFEGRFVTTLLAHDNKCSSYIVTPAGGSNENVVVAVIVNVTGTAYCRTRTFIRLVTGEGKTGFPVAQATGRKGRSG